MENIYFEIELTICSAIRAEECQEFDFRKIIIAEKRKKKLEIKRRNRALGLRR